MRTKLFFSSEAKAGGALQRFCETRGVDLTAVSLLQFNELPFTVDRPFDVVFFASPRSVNYFISHFSIPAASEIAAVGNGTAAVLTSLGYSTQFIGSKSGDPQAVATDFAQWLGNRTVLFPLSMQSNETIAAAVPEDQKIIVRCYETLPVWQEIPKQDVYVFTSPSNVEAFLQKNELPSDSTLIAWGKTTEKKLVSLGLKPDAVLEESSEECLVVQLESFSFS
jgi:uroporphyrinogen-III synthase